MRPALKRSRSLWDGLKTVPDETDLLRQMGNSFLTKNATKIGCNSKKQPFLVAFFILCGILTLEVNRKCHKITQH